MKENCHIYLPCLIRPRVQSAERDSQLPNKKMKTIFLSNMSESRRLTSTFFPIIKKLKFVVGVAYRVVVVGLMGSFVSDVIGWS